MQTIDNDVLPWHEQRLVGLDKLLNGGPISRSSLLQRYRLFHFTCIFPPSLNLVRNGQLELGIFLWLALERPLPEDPKLMLVDGKLVRELLDFFKILLFLVLELLIFELLLDQLLVGSLGSNALILYLFFQFNNLCIFLLVTILRSLDCSRSE